jgi:integrase
LKLGNKLLGFKYEKDVSEHIPKKWRLCIEALKNAPNQFCTLEELIIAMGYKNGIADRKAAQVAIYKLKSKGCLTSVCEKVELGATKKRRLFIEESQALTEWLNRLNSEETKEKFLPLFQKYFEWVKANGYYNTPDDMIKSRQEQENTLREAFKHIKPIQNYLKTANLSSGDSRSTYIAIRSFYKHNQAELPKWEIKDRKDGVFRIQTPQEPITLEEMRQLLINAPIREQAIFLISLQAGLDRSTLAKAFNPYAWTQLSKQLGSDFNNWDLSKAPIRINLIRIKTQTPYYTFISIDALKALQSWLKVRQTLTNKPIQNDEPIFITRQRTPIRKEQLSVMFNNLAIRAGLETKKYGKASEVRYRFHEHELRDTFKSACSANGVNTVASEYFIGHTIDKLGYDKSPDVYPEVYRQEYKKVEPYLNVISKPQAQLDKMEKNLTNKDKEIQNLKQQNEQLQVHLLDLNSRIDKVVDWMNENDPSIKKASKNNEGDT